MPACRWTRWCATCATASSSRSSSRSRSSLWSPLGQKLFGSEPPDPVRDRPRRLAVPAQPAGRPLLVVDLLHRRVFRPAQPDARHDGARRRRDRHRLDLLGRRDVLHRGRGLLRGRRACSPRSCCSGTGSRCAPAAAPTTPIRALLDLAPPMAVVLRDGEPVEVPTAEVQVGDLLLIRPGAKVPVDAVVEEGESEVDESTVTGESLPVHKTAGDELIGATINKNGTLRARATAVGSDTALAQIVKLVQEAQNSKAPGQRLADRAAFWLVLVALVGGGADLRRLVLRRSAATSRRRCCSRSPSWSSPAQTRSGSRPRRRSWSAAGSAPSAASSSSTRWRWSRRPRSTRSCSTRPAR